VQPVQLSLLPQTCPALSTTASPTLPPPSAPPGPAVPALPAQPLAEATALMGRLIAEAVAAEAGETSHE
jgi:hypothetical protein